jgi:hypothetical protein
MRGVFKRTPYGSSRMENLLKCYKAIRPSVPQYYVALNVGLLGGRNHTVSGLDKTKLFERVPVTSSAETWRIEWGRPQWLNKTRRVMTGSVWPPQCVVQSKLKPRTVKVVKFDGGGMFLIKFVSYFTIISATNDSKQSKVYDFIRVKFPKLFSSWLQPYNALKYRKISEKWPH